MFDRHPERGFVGRDIAQAFLGPRAKLTAVLHFDKGEGTPPAFLEEYAEFQIAISGFEALFASQALGSGRGRVYGT
jgi:hypothetical protein